MKRAEEKCYVCGENLGQCDVDCTSEFICSTCSIIQENEAPRKPKSSAGVEISFVKRFYDAIEAREIVCMEAISILENLLGTDFHNTSDFRSKMQAYLDKHFYKGVDLRRARKYAGMEQSDLAELFGISKLRIKQMETNKKPLSDDAIDFIRVMGGERRVTSKKVSKRRNLGLGMHNAKNSIIPPEKTIPKQHISSLIKCQYCGELKEDWEITIDCPDPYHSFLVCEDCYSNQQKGEG